MFDSLGNDMFVYFGTQSVCNWRIMVKAGGERLWDSLVYGHHLPQQLWRSRGQGPATAVAECGKLWLPQLRRCFRPPRFVAGFVLYDSVAASFHSPTKQMPRLLWRATSSAWRVWPQTKHQLILCGGRVCGMGNGGAESNSPYTY
jgi:hypothetical protein